MMRFMLFLLFRKSIKNCIIYEMRVKRAAVKI